MLFISMIVSLCLCPPRVHERVLNIKVQTSKTAWPGSSVGGSFGYAKVAGLISSQGTYKKQPMNAQISGTTNQ